MKQDLSGRVRARTGGLDYSLSHGEACDDRFGYESELFQPQWSISSRMVVFTLGICGLILSTRVQGGARKGLRLFGVASLIRAVTNLHVTDLIGWIANPVVHLKRNIRIQAPVEDVYDFLSHFSNYPSFMSYVQEVEVNDQGELRWTLQGPAGGLIHWNTSLGKMIKNQAISWKSSVNSLIRNSGDILLIDRPGEGTDVHIELTYAPPMGALGYAVVHFFGFDPKEKIDEDLKTLKDFIESGKRASRLNREQLDFRQG